MADLKSWPSWLCWLAYELRMPAEPRQSGEGGGAAERSEQARRYGASPSPPPIIHDGRTQNFGESKIIQNRGK